MESAFLPQPVLVLVDATVDVAHEAEFNRWYDERHLKEIVACPGIQWGARYRSSDDEEAKYLAMYSVDDEAALSTPELRAVSGFAHLAPNVRYERRMFRPVSSYAKGAPDVQRFAG